ncbi:MAG TPA: MoaD/ThiS family protein [Terriglobales bacterium]
MRFRAHPAQLSGQPDALVAVAPHWARGTQWRDYGTAKAMPFHNQTRESLNMIRIILPFHLRTLAHVGSEVTLEVTDMEITAGHATGVTVRSLLDALEARYPMLRGAIRDHDTLQRRPFLRFFACEEDLSHQSPDAPLPNAVVSGKEPFVIIGAIAGG